MEAIRLGRSMQEVGPRRPNPGVTSGVGAGLDMHVAELPARMTRLMAHYAGVCVECVEGKGGGWAGAIANVRWVNATMLWLFVDLGGPRGG